MSQARDHSTLKWIMGELEATIGDARRSLEDYVEGEGNRDAMQECAEKLRQVAGTLQMVEVYGGQMLAEEMEAVARAMADNAVRQTDSAAELLMLAMVQLPGYLERLQAGNEDTPLALLSLLNDLRATRDAPLLSEASLFSPNIDEAPVPEHLTGEPNPALRELARGLRANFHRGLLDWFRDVDTAGGLAQLKQVVGEIKYSAATIQTYRLFDVAGAVLEGLADGCIEQGVAVKQLIGRIDREIKRLIDTGEGDLVRNAPTALLGNLLYYVARCETENPRLLEVKAAFDLEHALPTDAELSAGLDFAAPGQEVMQVVSEAIKEELTAVKDNLDLYIRSGSKELRGLLALEAPLHKLADTLGMVGQGELRSRLQRQVDWIRSQSDSGAEPEDQKLMEMAADFLFVDSALDSLSGKAVGDEGLPQGEYQVLRDTIMREATSDLAKIKASIVEFIDTPDDPALLTEVPHFLRNISGAFRILELGEAAQIVDVLSAFVRERVLKGLVPDQEQLDSLADVITSIEYFNESLVEGYSNQPEILSVAREALKRLGYELAESGEPAEPVAEIEATRASDEEIAAEQVKGVVEEDTVPAAAEPPVEHAVEQPEAEETRVGPAEETALEEPAAEQSQAPVEPAVAASPDEDLIDPEILEIFLEEAREELDVIRENVPRWQKNPDDEEALRTFRRSFHTLKGSGRMVGATVIGEFAWSIENLLNRVIDGTAQPGGKVQNILNSTLELLPGLIDCQEAGTPPQADVRPLMKEAFELAGAEPPEAFHAIPGPTTAAPTPAVGMGAAEESGAETGEAPTTEAAEAAEAPEIEAPEIEVPAEAVTAVEEVGEEVAEPEIDPELLQIFATETRAHLETLRECVASAKASGVCEDTQKIFRALHTLHGSAHLADVEPVAAIGAALEHLVDDMQKRHQPASDNVFSLLEQAADTVEACVDALESGSAQLPESDALVASIDGERERLAAAESEALRAAEEAEAAAPPPVPTVEEVEAAVPPPEPVVEEAPVEVPAAAEADVVYQQAEGDEELVEIFLEEARELLDTFETGLQAWVNSPKEAGPLAELQRTLHTLKGGARLAGLTAVGDLSHAFESLLTGVRDDRILVSDALVRVGQEVADRLTEQIEDLAEKGRVKVADDLIASVEQLLAGEEPEAAPVAAETAAPQPEPVAPPPEEQPAAGPAQAQAPATPAPRAKQEQVRVRSDLLDRLVNNAGEVSIYRARIEQQNGELSFNLNELEQTVMRLQEQLRNLDNETEAQILFRYEREKEEDAETEAFDPLELDRFSTMQQLSRSLVETVNDLVNIKDLMLELSRETETLLLQQSRVATDLQDGLLRTRMVPFSQLVPRLHRIVRQTATQLDKQVNLEVVGAEGEMDRGILERMIAPLEHILRNAVSHGIEDPGAREAAGKPPGGKITLSLYREGTEVVLEVADDGSGLSLAAIRARAEERGLLAPGAKVRDDDLMQFILAPGFSTATQVTQISGRGVGMDVVVSELKQIGGALDIDSQEGSGSTFTIRLPFTLAISDALLVQLGDDVFAVPHGSIEGVVRVTREQLMACYRGEQAGFSYAGHDYQVRYLGGMLHGTQAILQEQKRWFPLMLVRAGEHRVALQVDDLIGNRQIVVKSVGSQLSTVRWISGGTILADGRVALILDVSALVRMDAARTAEVEEMAPQLEVEETRPKERTLVMVVDDSITVRKVTTRLLTRHGMDVVTAKDGVDAVALLQDQVPDIMLLDIEMPRMDGYELARHVRNSDGLRHIPIIMITSRTGEKHRDRAMELGVNRYLGKPYQESDLLENIHSALAEVAT